MDMEVLKRELSKVKMDIVRVMEEKRKAESETNISVSKREYCLSSIEALSREIEDINEEQVLVELAKIEAVKEHEEIEGQRRRDTAKYSAAIGETRKKILKLIQQMKGTKGMQEKLDFVLSDISMLQNELMEIRKRPKLEVVMHEMEVAMKRLAAVKEEECEYIAYMDVLRDELNKCSNERIRIQKEEEKTEMKIQNLNSKLLSANLKMEAISAAKAKTNLVLSNLLLSHEHLKSKAGAANEECLRMREETKSIREEMQRTEAEVELGEEILQFAMQDLQEVKSSESKALDDLELLTKKIARNRASMYRPTINISMFEYEYLKGQAHEAVAIADEKVAAAQAWAEAVKTSEKEIQLKIESLSREKQQLKVDQKPQESIKAKKELANELVNWEQGIEPENIKLKTAIPSKEMNRSIKMIPRQRKGKGSISFTVSRRAKLMRNLGTALRGRSILTNL